MRFFARVRHLFDHIVHDAPGERFTRYYERRRERGEEHPVRRWMIIGLGAALVALGMIMLVTPGPGLLTIGAGCVLIAARSRWMAERLDRLEVALRRGLRHLGHRSA